jgi:hypothetical protein
MPFMFEFVDDNVDTYVFDDISEIQEEISNQNSKSTYANDGTRFILKDGKSIIKRKTEDIDSAWYDQPGVDKEKYFQFLRSKAKTVIQAPSVIEDEGVVIETVKQQPKKPTPKNVLTENKGLKPKEAGKQGLEEILEAKKRESLKQLEAAVAKARTAGKLALDKQKAAMAEYIDTKKRVIESIQDMLKSQVVNGVKVSIPPITAGRVNKILDKVLKGKSYRARYKIDPGGNRVPFISSADQAIQEAYKIIQEAVRSQDLSRARSNRVAAKRNVKAGKLGVLPTGGTVDQFLQIDPSIIPLDVFDEYMDVLDMIGKRSKALPLSDQGDLAQSINDILDAVEDENGRVETLAITYSNFPKETVTRKDPATGKKVTKESFSKTIEKMLNTGVITKRDFDLMKRRRAEIEMKAPSTKTKVQMTKAEADIAVARAESMVKNLPSAGAGFTSYQNEIIRNLKSLTKKDLNNFVKEIKDDKGNVTGYDISELVLLSKVMENVSNGFITNLSQMMSEKINEIRGAEKVAAVISNYKNRMIDFVSKLKASLRESWSGGAKKTSLINEKIRRSGNYAIDIALNNFKNSDVYNTILRPISVAIEKKDTEIQNIIAEISQITNKIKDKDLFRQNTLVRLIQLHKMHLSDPTMPTVQEWLDATKKGGNSQYLPETLDKIQAIIDSAIVNGEFDLDAAKAGLTKEGAQLLDKIEDLVMNRLSEKAAFGSTVIRGTRVPILDYYTATPRVLNTDRSAKANQADALVSTYSQPSSRAATFYEKTKQAHEISFDAIESTLWSAKHTLTDFYLTPHIRTAKAIIKRLVNSDFKGDQKEAVLAIESVLNDSIEMVLHNQWNEKHTAEKVGDFIQSKAYQAMLSGFVRPVVEFASNASYALVENNEEFMKGVSVLTNGAPKLPDGSVKPGFMSDVVFNLGSNQLNRLFNLTGQSSKAMDRKTSFSYDPIRNEVSGLRRFAKIAGSVNDKFDYFSNSTLSKPDQIISRAIFFGALSFKYKELTGKDIDLDKISNDDQEYIQANFNNLRAATEYADSRVSQGFSSSNNFDGILRNQKLKTTSLAGVVWGNFNGFMNKFLVSEYVTSVKAINAMTGNGDLTPKQGARLLMAQAARMYTYKALMSYFGTMVYGATSGLILSLMGIDAPEEEEEERAEEKWYNNFAKNVASLIGALAIDRNFGNMAKIITSTGLEYANKELGEGATYVGEYKQFEDGVTFPFFDVDKKPGGQGTFEKSAIRLSGPFSPYMNNLSDFMGQYDYYSLAVKPEKRDKWKGQMQFTGARTLWLMSGFPLYREANKIANEVAYKMAKDADDAKKKVKP